MWSLLLIACSQDARVADLESRNGVLEARVAELEKQIAACSGVTGGVSAPPSPEGVAVVAPDRFTVERSVIDGVLADPDSWAKQGRAVPHEDAAGNIDGFTISGIRRTGLLAGLGLQNGDVVQTVNGRPITSLEDGLAAYASLQTESTYTLEIVRRGAPRKIVVDVR
jgi:type II secretory pathway component PulC